MIQTLNTIHMPEKVYETAGNPMLVTCNDLHEWVCKHSFNSSILVNELLGSCFASSWGLKTPERSLINVKIEHIPINIPNINFDKPCFGSKYIKSSNEIDETSLNLFSNNTFRNKIKNKNDFLMIALFDIWLSNEDRNHNNSNLLIDFSKQSEIYFTVFDHDAIFNTNSLSKGLYQINCYESLIYSPLAKVLFKKDQDFIKTVDNLIKRFYICVSSCESDINNIVSLIPTQWNINKQTLTSSLQANLFSEKWLKDCENNFRTIIQENIK